MSSTESSNPMSKVQGFMGDQLGKILDLPDKPKNPGVKKALYIIFDLGLILLPIAALILMNGVSLHGGFHFASISHIGATILTPSAGFSSISTFMFIGVAGAGVGVGSMWLTEDVLGKKHAESAGKVMAVMAPILMLVGAGFLIYGGGAVHGSHGLAFSYGKAMGSGWAILGFLMVPAALLVASVSVGALQKDKSIPILKETGAPSNQAADRRRHHREDEHEMIRLDTRVHSSEFSSSEED